MIRESAEHGEQNICSGDVFASLLQLVIFFTINLYWPLKLTNHRSGDPHLVSQ